MRLRNVTGSREYIADSRFVIHNPEECKGKWNEIFGNHNQIRIEIGMGKGKFIIENALKYPNINFDTEKKYRLYRTVYEILHPTISKKNISNYKIIVDENLSIADGAIRYLKNIVFLHQRQVNYKYVRYY